VRKHAWRLARRQPLHHSPVPGVHLPDGTACNGCCRGCGSSCLGACAIAAAADSAAAVAHATAAAVAVTAAAPARAVAAVAAATMQLLRRMQWPLPWPRQQLCRGGRGFGGSLWRMQHNGRCRDCDSSWRGACDGQVQRLQRPLPRCSRDCDSSCCSACRMRQLAREPGWMHRVLAAICAAAAAAAATLSTTLVASMHERAWRTRTINASAAGAGGACGACRMRRLAREPDWMHRSAVKITSRCAAAAAAATPAELHTVQLTRA
jgi:hypothetical protein